MSEQMFIDDTIDTQDYSEDVAVAVDTAPEGGEDSNYADLQDRMAGDVEDSPWYSESEGKVVTAGGSVILDPATNKPYESMEAYQASINATAKPKIEDAPKNTTPIPGTRSFESMVSGETLTPEKLYELSNVATDFTYNDNLVPKVDAAYQSVGTAQESDPIQAVNDERDLLVSRMVSPINDIKEWMLSEGAPPELVAAKLNPIIEAQNAQIKAHYDKSYQEAFENKTTRPITEMQKKADAREIELKSQSNIERLAKTYYPKEGKDAYFALINGYKTTGPDGKEVFTRGPASGLVDLLVSASIGDKTFKTEAEMLSEYKTTFNRTTADPVKAQMLFDLAHFYWIGKQSSKLQKMSYDKGKESAQQQQQRVNRTIKTPPASYQAPSTDDDDAGMPSMLRAVMGGIGKR